jgi:hypothetical protein
VRTYCAVGTELGARQRTRETRGQVEEGANNCALIEAAGASYTSCRSGYIYIYIYPRFGVGLVPRQCQAAGASYASCRSGYIYIYISGPGSGLFPGRKCLLCRSDSRYYSALLRIHPSDRIYNKARQSTPRPCHVLTPCAEQGGGSSPELGACLNRVPWGVPVSGRTRGAGETRLEVV